MYEGLLDEDYDIELPLKVTQLRRDTDLHL